MRRRGLAPMQTRIVVVDRVKAVVEQKHVHRRADDVAGVIDGRLLVRVHVLHVVEDQNDKQRNLLRNENVQQGLLPIDHERSHEEAHQQHVFRDAEPEAASIDAVLLLQVFANRLLLMKPTHRGICEKREEIGVLRVAIGDGVVTLTVVELVVVLIMRRDPTEGRESIEQREPVVGERVQRLRLQPALDFEEPPASSTSKS